MPSRLSARALPVLLAAPLLVAVTGGPASACSCIGSDLQENHDRADVVLTGQVLLREEESCWSTSSVMVTYVVWVDREL